MGKSLRQTKEADDFHCAVFTTERLQTPLNPDAFHAAKPTHLELGKIPDLELRNPADPRVWELLIRGGARFRTDVARGAREDRESREARLIHLNLLIDFLQIEQSRLGDDFLFLRDKKDIYLRLTSPEAVDTLAQALGCPAKRQLAYYGALAPWEDFTNANQEFWPISLVAQEHDIPPYQLTHPWLFGWHDVAHREQQEAAAGIGQNMANILVRAALSVVPEIAEWDETYQIFELLAQMDPLAAKPQHVQTLILTLCAGLRKELRRHPEAKERIEKFLVWVSIPSPQ